MARRRTRSRTQRVRRAERTERTQPAPGEKAATGTAWLWATLGVTVFAGLHLAGSALGGAWWGVHFFRYLDGPGFAGAAAIVLAGTFLALPRGRRLLGRLPSWSIDTLAAAAMLGFGWLLRDRTHLLGDGSVVIENASQPYVFHDREPLAGLVHHGLARGLGVFGLEPQTALELGSCLFGALLVVLLIRADRDLRLGGLLIVLGLVNGAAQLWFGYIEHYPPLALVLVATLLIVQPAVERPVTVLPLLLSAGIALALHISAILLAPAVAWCLFRQLRLRPARGRLALIAEIAVAVALLGLGWELTIGRFEGAPSFAGYLGILGEAGHFGYSGSARPENAPTLFSLGHLAEYANVLALISIVNLPLLVGALATGGGRRALLESWPIALALTTGACLAAQFVFFPSLGAPRDWDALAIGAFPLAFLAAVLLSRATRPSWLLPLVTLLGLAHTVPWILVNANAESADARFREVPLPRGQAKFVFATRALKAGRTEEAAEQFEEVLRNQPDSIHSWYRLGLARQILGEPEPALVAFQRALALQEIDPRISRGELLLRIGTCLWRLGRNEEAAPIFAETLRERPDEETPRVFLAVRALEANDYAQVLELLEPVGHDGWESPAPLVVGWEALRGLGREEEAAARLREAGRLFPDDPQVQKLLAEHP